MLGNVVPYSQQMGCLVEEKVVLDICEFAGLQRKAFNGGNSFACPPAGLSDKLSNVRPDPPGLPRLHLSRGLLQLQAAIPHRALPARAASGSLQCR